MSEKDGGPAFPNWEVKPVGPHGTDTTVPTAGMRLRDYFAGQALTKAHDGGWRANPETITALAAYCYAVADAMLATRSRTGGEG